MNPESIQQTKTLQSSTCFRDLCEKARQTDGARTNTEPTCCQMERERAEPRETVRVAQSAHGYKQQVSHKLFQIGQKKQQNTKQVVCVWKMDSRSSSEVCVSNTNHTSNVVCTPSV